MGVLRSHMGDWASHIGGAGMCHIAGIGAITSRCETTFRGRGIYDTARLSVYTSNIPPTPAPTRYRPDPIARRHDFRGFMSHLES